MEEFKKIIQSYINYGQPFDILQTQRFAGSKKVRITPLIDFDNELFAGMSDDEIHNELNKLFNKLRGRLVCNDVSIIIADSYDFKYSWSPYSKYTVNYWLDEHLIGNYNIGMFKNSTLACDYTVEEVNNKMAVLINKLNKELPYYEKVENLHFWSTLLYGLVSIQPNYEPQDQHKVRIEVIEKN